MTIPRSLQVNVSFAGKAFCFTGVLAHLRRTAAQREVRARGGFTLDAVTPQLDYLVIGDTPSPAWKYGKFGRKIEAARALAGSRPGRPRLISETTFVESLAEIAAPDAAKTAQRVVVATYRFVVPADCARPDFRALEIALQNAETQLGCHVAVTSHWIGIHAELFGSKNLRAPRLGTAFTCRFVRLVPLDEGVTALLEPLQRSLEHVAGLDGVFHWFERVDGSADYVRLIRQMPSMSRVPLMPSS